MTPGEAYEIVVKAIEEGMGWFDRQSTFEALDRLRDLAQVNPLDTLEAEVEEATQTWVANHPDDGSKEWFRVRYSFDNTEHAVRVLKREFRTLRENLLKWEGKK